MNCFTRDKSQQKIKEVCHCYCSQCGKRIEYNKRIMVMSNTGKEEFIINPDGGFKHFGNVNGDFIIVKGSVPGTYRRLIKLRKQIRKEPKKITKPNVLEIVI